MMFSTHDFSDTASLPPGMREGWVDVKAPGDGRIYRVATVELKDTGVANVTDQFSGVAVTMSDGTLMRPIVIGNSAPTATVLAVMLQIEQAGSAPIQRYFWGQSLQATTEHNSTNARAISVFPGATQPETRIAICGESYETELPLSAGAIRNPNAPFWNSPAGYVAVFDGLGNLLWTRHFFGSVPTDAVAITDVSIRVEDPGTQAREVVTYCGISTVGVPTTNPGNFAPIAWFAAPSGACPNAASGNTDNSLNGTSPSQWDGIVGRLTRIPGNNPVTLCHAVLGGRGQDGLFGLAEITADRFVVVGSTSTQQTPQPGDAEFPFTAFAGSANCFSMTTVHCVGTMAIFSITSPLVAPPFLNLESAIPLGSFGTLTHTIARDVLIQPDVLTTTSVPVNRICIVGSTNDSNMPASIGVTAAGGFQPALSGNTDGYVVTLWDTPAGTVPELFSYRGGPNNDGLTGVGAWNEYPDHISIVGFADLGTSPAVQRDIDIASIFIDRGAAPAALDLIRELSAGGSALDFPVGMGDDLATKTGTGVFFDTFALGDPQGGGIAVDVRGRIAACGTTIPDPSQTLQWSFPITGFPFPTGRLLLSGQDAVRMDLDMLPSQVLRTDGTGTLAGAPNPNAGPAPALGGTTPFCGLRPFGHQVGQPRPPLRRMFIDYDGPAPAAGVSPDIVIDQLPKGVFVASLLHVGFPNSLPTPFPGTPQVELWVNQAAMVVLPEPNTEGSIRRTLFPSGGLPTSGGTITIQIVSLVQTAITCGTTGLGVIASPGLALSF